MQNKELVISFPGITKDLANRFAKALADDLKLNIVGLQKAESRRDDESAQDFGATIVLILGTAAATAVAKGIRTWLERNNTSAELYENGTVIVKNLKSEDIATIAKAMSSK